MKAKAEIIEILERAMLSEEAHSMQRMDVLSSLLDYVQSSKDERAEMAELAKAHERNEI